MIDEFGPRQEIQDWTFCPKCRTMKSLEVAFAPDSDICRDCLAARIRKQRTKRSRNRRRAIFADLHRQLKAARAPEAMLAIVVAMADSAFGGIGPMCQEFRRLALDESTSDFWRLRSMQVWLEVACVAELRRLERQEREAATEQSCEAVLRHFHQQGELIFALRKLLADGLITLDQIDPPPPDHRFAAARLD